MGSSNQYDHEQSPLQRLANEIAKPGRTWDQIFEQFIAPARPTANRDDFSSGENVVVRVSVALRQADDNGWLKSLLDVIRAHCEGSGLNIVGRAAEEMLDAVDAVETLIKEEDQSSSSISIAERHNRNRRVDQIRTLLPLLFGRYFRLAAAGLFCLYLTYTIAIIATINPFEDAVRWIKHEPAYNIFALLILPIAFGLLVQGFVQSRTVENGQLQLSRLTKKTILISLFVAFSLGGVLGNL